MAQEVEQVTNPKISSLIPTCFSPHDNVCMGIMLIPELLLMGGLVPCLAVSCIVKCFMSEHKKRAVQVQFIELNNLTIGFQCDLTSVNFPEERKMCHVTLSATVRALQAPITPLCPL